MWTWSDLHCDFVHPVGDNYPDQLWIRNLSIVQSDGAFDYNCAPDSDHSKEYGWIMNPRSIEQNWTEIGYFRRHDWKADHGCLQNGSCVYVGNKTYATLPSIHTTIEFNAQDILICIIGGFISLLTIGGNSVVNIYFLNAL